MKISELRSNYTQHIQQNVRKPKETANRTKEAYREKKLLIVKNTVRLLEESINTYHDFIKDEASRIRSHALSEFCSGTDDECPVREAVGYVLASFGECAADLRKNAEKMVAVVHKTIKCASAAH